LSEQSPGKAELPAMRGVKEYLNVALPSAATTADGLVGSEREAGGSRSVTRIIIPESGLQEETGGDCCYTSLLQYFANRMSG